MIEKLPELYRIKYKELLEKIDNTVERKEKRKIFNDFIKKYTAIPDIWKLWIIYEQPDLLKALKESALTHFFDEDFLQYDEDECKKTFVSQNNRKFSFVISHPYFYCIKETMTKNTECWKEIDHALSFPHHYLKNVRYFCEEFSENFESKRIERLSLVEEYYQELMAAFDTDDIERWCCFLFHTKHNDVIIQNMEYYIAKKPYQKEAWIKYINFMDEINNFKAMLGIYSRYCRFFLDDDEIKKEYFQKVIHLHLKGENVNVWFFDSKEILFESNLKDFYDSNVKNVNSIISVTEISENFETLKTNYEKKIDVLEVLEVKDIWFMKDELNFMKTFDTDIFLVDNTIVKEPILNVGKNDNIDINVLSIFNEDDKKCKIKWNNSNTKTQNFPFYENILHYIFSSKNYSIQQKLYQSCKYFYAKFKTPLCYYLCMTDDERTEFGYQKFEISSADLFHCNDNPGNDDKEHFSFLNYLQENMTIATSLFILKPLNNNCFTQIFKTFKKIHIKYLFVCFQTINLQDLILLNETCNLIRCTFIDVDVMNAVEDSCFSAIEDIIINLSSLKKILLKCPKSEYTVDTAKKLADLPSDCHFSEFIILNATEKFHPIEFCNFLKRHASNNCKFEVGFNDDVNDSYGRNFYQTVCKYLDSWEPRHYAPSFLFSASFPHFYDHLS